MNYFERLFEQELARISPIFRCVYLKIPDMIYQRGVKIIEHKRFCDGILVTPAGNYLIECKYGNSPLRPHQKKTMQEVNKIGNSYFVIRKKVLKRGIFYTVEQSGTVCFKTEDISNLFRFFQMPEEYTSQKIMLDCLPPEKKKRKLRKVYL